LLGDWHISDLLNAAGSVGACPAFFPFSLSELSRRRMFGAAGTSQEPCAGGSEDRLIANETSLLAKWEALAPSSPPEFSLLLLNFPNPKRAPRPAFFIL
jgi:hypothetical protein